MIRDHEVPATGQCFVCGRPGLTPGSFCVPCDGFVCWTHREPGVARHGVIHDHSRCDHGREK